MENEKFDNVRTVTFADLWGILTQRILVIAAVALVGTLLLFMVGKATYTPSYKSTATLYISRQAGVTTSGDASTEFSLALKLVNDCTYFLKSHTVLDQVISDLNLELSYKELDNSITTHNPDNTRILEVAVEADSPELAKQIVDHICRIAPQVIENTMGYRQVQLFEMGTLSQSPSNRTSAVVYVLIFGVLAALTYGVFLVAYLMDDRIRTDEDIERILGLSILGNIPDANSTQNDVYGYGAYQAKKKKGGRA